MDCCPVCYETFSSSPPEVLGRQLPCEHVACTQCLQDCFEDVGGRCDNNQPVSVVSCPSFGVVRAPPHVNTESTTTSPNTLFFSLQLAEDGVSFCLVL